MLSSEKQDVRREPGPLALGAVAIAGVSLFVVLAFVKAAGGQSSIPQQQLHQSPDEVLWNAIRQHECAEVTSNNTPFDQRIHETIRHKELLVEKIQSYQLLYPGGAHFQSSVDRELETLFEICTLLGDFARLESRIGQIDATPTDGNTRAMAAWWRIHLLERSKPDEFPARTGLLERDRRYVQAMAAFARRYPGSPYAIRAATLVAEDCIRRRDFEAASEWIRQLNETAPDSLAAINLAGMLRRANSLGKQLTGSLAPIGGGSLDVASLRGSRVAIACWNSAEGDSRQFAVDLQRQFFERNDVRIVGVDLNPSVEETRRWAKALQLSWIQTNDRCGRGGIFVRHWGIDDAPTLIWVDVSGLIEVFAGPGEYPSALNRDSSEASPHSQPAGP